MGISHDNLDFFCRINVQSELPFKDFVASVARRAGSTGFMNEIKSRALDISVHKNDIFDPMKSSEGDDRWLYFRYTLETDPIAGTSPCDYIAAIGALLRSLWSSDMDAVAACEFEDQLPQNERRMNWGKNAERVDPLAPRVIASADSIISPPVTTAETKLT